MKIHAVIHASFEKLGAIEDWAAKHNHQIQQTYSYNNEPLPNADDFDALIVMGGPQSPLEIDKYPYLNDEIDLIKQTLKADKPILGVCLGAQLIGEALGAKTEKSPEREVGVYPLQLAEVASQDDLFRELPNTINVSHWHGDMPGLTSDSVVLAKSEGCPRQIIRYREKVYSFQCHFELKLENIEEMAKACPEDLSPGKYIMTIEQMRQQNYSEIHQTMELLLDRLFG